MEPDFEALAIAYLNPLLTEPVSARVPNPRPASFVQVELTGGGGVTDEVLCDALLFVSAWAPSLVSASQLARSAGSHFRDWEGQSAGESFIYASRPSTPRRFPDPLSAAARYVFTVSVTARAV